ncbi:asparaginase domain-containing protein [Actinophytocola sediminis]
MSGPLLLLATGDTMAHRLASVATGAELLATAGPTGTRIVVEDVLAEPSWDISTATQLALARRVRQALAADGFAGVVVTHGLDTLADTAFLADLVAGPVAARGSIVFTGAATTLAAAHPDGPANLADAIALAADPAARGAGALVGLGGEVHAARWATLADSATVTSWPRRPLGRVAAGQVRLGARPPRPPRGPVEPEADVALLSVYPDMPPSLVTTVTDAGARGLVLAGTGAGNVPVELFTPVVDATAMDIPVVVASRVPTTGIGLVGRMGAFGAGGLPPSKARVALMVAIGDGGGVAAARAWFAAWTADQSST